MPIIEPAASEARKTDKRAELFNRSEALIRLLCKQYIADHFFTRDVMCPGLAINLRLDQGRLDVAGTDGIAGDVCSAVSSAVTLVSPTIPCLAATYADLYGDATKSCADAILMMRPHLFASIEGSVNRVV
jgi:hypothetical protein